MENDGLIEIERDDDDATTSTAAVPNANVTATDDANASGNTVAVIETDSSMRLKNVALIWNDGTETSSAADSISVTHNWDLSVYENRLRTFESGWVLPFITPTQMAEAGLYYLGNQDHVRCMMCSKEFAHWKQDVDPYDEHKRVSPDCQFFKDNQGDVDDASSTIDMLNIVSDRFNNYQKFFHFREIILPHNKSFTSLETRLETFVKCIKLKQNIRTFCEAGLYYIGDGENDKMLCFCCSQGLMDWEYHDDPWVEHARWSPNCSFVLLSKGKDFVEQVLSESDNMYKERQDSSETSSTKNISKTLAVMNLRNFSQEDKSLENVIMPESMLCKICYKEKMEVLSIPCGHIFACIQCAVSLDQCAVCRKSFTTIVRIDIRVKEMINHLNLAPRLFPKHSGESTDLLTCVICRKEEMGIVFVPCTHIACCEDCANKTKACPVCFEIYHYYLQVYL